jgi:hypothetical protein
MILHRDRVNKIFAKLSAPLLKVFAMTRPPSKSGAIAA